MTFTCKSLPRVLSAIVLMGFVFALAPGFGLSQAQLKKSPRQKGNGKTVVKEIANKGQEATATLPKDWVKSLKWRSIGPANMGGRITAISVFEADPSIQYIATASGGLLKTVNNGVTFEYQFQHENTVSIGDVCVAPSNANIVWVGTGEHNPRNSVSYGDGVYKSVDGGKSWKHMGLKQTYQTGKILVHPTNPDIVYVGAMGRCYGPNAQRGLFKTTDGGKTWKKILYKDENTGIIDMRMHPKDPDTLLVAMWERRRDEFDSFLNGSAPEGRDTYDPVVRWGKNAGIYKTTDGGTTFRRLTKGLPTCNFGRVGLDYCLHKPNIVYAIISTEKIGKGTPPKQSAYLGIQGKTAKNGVELTAITARSPAERAGLKKGDIVIKFGKNKIEKYEQLGPTIRKFKAGDKVVVDVLRGGKRKTIEVTLGSSRTGGGIRRPGVGGPGGSKKGRPYHAFYGGQAANKQDVQGPNGHEYGGVYKSMDGGESWQRVNSINPRPMYFSEIRVDPSDENRVYVLGVGMAGSTDGGKKFSSRVTRGIHADQHALWINPKNGRHMIVGTDGGHYVTYDRMKNWDHFNQMALGQFYHVAVCSKRPYYVYGGLQDNGTWGGPSVGLHGTGPINEDWLSVGGGDGFKCRIDPHDPDLVYFTSQNGNMRRRNMRTGATSSLRPRTTGRPGQARKRHRFNWNTPFILSHHNSKIHYSAGEYVFRSVQQGSNARKISPEITRTKRGSATALAESPKNPQVLWVGTDDGALWVTRNGGREWTNVYENVGLPGPRWCATIEASRFKEGVAYVAFDAHRSDDDNPYLYMTDDFGKSWKNITANLPTGSTRCLREDVTNPNLLYTGTEFAVFASLNQGKTWTRINNNLPTVAVHEIAVHPTAGEIVAATHGRSLWILNVSALRQMTPKVLEKEAHLYAPKTAISWHRKPTRGRTNRRFVGTNPYFGAEIFYSLKKNATKVSVSIQDINGKTLRTLKGAAKSGLQRVGWDLRQTTTRRTGGRPGTGRPGGGRGSILDRLKSYDKNKDGKLTKAELPAFFQRLFDRGDTNKDKVIDQKELNRLAQSFGSGRGRGGFGRSVAPGMYRIVLNVDGTEYRQVVRVEADPNGPRNITVTQGPEDEKEDWDQQDG